MNDLKRIRGIGQSIEQRLNQAGIFTFVEFANLSTKDLASILFGIPGISAERISENGWISQAKKLARKEAKVDKLIPDNNVQSSALFSIDLLIDQRCCVRRTHILHVQSLKESSWAGWNQNKLSSFILENAFLKPTPTTAKEIENDLETKSLEVEESQETGLQEIHGDLYISEVEIQPKQGKVVKWLVSKNEPFAVGLILDMGAISIPSGTKLQYHAEIQVKNLADGTRQNIGEEKGIIESQNLFPLVVNCHAMPEGSYRLEAYVILSPDLENRNPKPHLMAMTEGKVFRVV
jgi:hypothetical protein